MTCKDCIHYRACKNTASYFGGSNKNNDTFQEYELRQEVEKDCADFKPNSRYIELPCAVGDYVEWDNGLIKTLYCVRGYMCDDAGFRFILDDFAPVINHSNITRTLTKEEAEKALERSEGK